jgi:hypothetical protein
MRGPRKIRRIALMAIGYLAPVVLGGCSSKSSALSPVISVSFIGGSSQTITQGQSVTITANVANDPSGKGVTWKLTAGPGALSKETSTSAEYDAPASVASIMSATVTATAVADMSKSATFAVTVTFPPTALIRLSTDTLTNSTSQHASRLIPSPARWIISFRGWQWIEPHRATRPI